MTGCILNAIIALVYSFSTWQLTVKMSNNFWLAENIDQEIANSILKKM